MLLVGGLSGSNSILGLQAERIELRVETDSSGKCTWSHTTTTKAFRFPFNPDNNPVAKLLQFETEYETYYIETKNGLTYFDSV